MTGSGLAPTLRPGPSNDQSDLQTRVGSAPARSVARVARRPLVMRGLDDAVDWALTGIHVVQAIEGTNRLRVRGCPCFNPRTRKWDSRSAGRASYLARKGGASPQASKHGCAHHSCELLSHGHLL